MSRRELAMRRAPVGLVLEGEIEARPNKDRGDLRLVTRARETLWVTKPREQPILQFGVVVKRV